MAGRYKKCFGRNLRFVAWLLTFLLFAGLLAGCAPGVSPETYRTESALSQAETQEMAGQDLQAADYAEQAIPDGIREDGNYRSKEEVALYLHTYGHLPDNYISKKEAQSLGWDSKKGNLDEVAPGKSIGGSHYGNYEGQLPEKEGRKYYECDLDYEGGYRGAKRLVYSDDGLIFYTEDHYKTFEQLY